MLKRVLAVYFSGTGTTEKTVKTIAKKAADELRLEYGEWDFTPLFAREKPLSFTDEDLVIFGMPVIVYKGAIEGGAFGAALIAGVAANIYEDIFDATNILKPEDMIEPYKQNISVYNEAYNVYKNMYDHFKCGFEAMGA